MNEKYYVEATRKKEIHQVSIFDKVQLVTTDLHPEMNILKTVSYCHKYLWKLDEAW